MPTLSSLLSMIARPFTGGAGASRPTTDEETGRQRTGGVAIGSGLGVFAGARPNPGTYETYRDVAAHPTFALAWLTLTGPILASSWRVERDEDAPEQAEKFVAKVFGDLRAQLVRDCLRAGLYGWSPFEKVFEVRKVNGENRVAYRKLKWLAPDVSLVLVGRQSGRFAGLRNSGDGTTVDLPAEQAFVYTWFREGGDWYGTMRRDFPAERARPFVGAWRDEHARQAVYSSKVAGIIPVLFYPPGSSTNADGVEVDNAVTAKKVLDELGSGRGVAIPNLALDSISDPRQQGELAGKSLWSLTFLNAGQDASQGFNERLIAEDKMIVRAVGIPERAITEANTAGSRADAGVASDAALLASTLLDVDITNEINRYLVNPLLVYNFGPETANAVRLTPAPLLDDSKSAFRQLAQVVLGNPTIAPEAPQWVDWSSVFEGAGIPLDRTRLLTTDDFARAAALLAQEATGAADGAAPVPTGAEDPAVDPSQR